MENRVFKRKIYNQMVEWKRNSKGSTALLVEGARRIGKSTIVEEFAKNEYQSYILIDFNEASKEVKALFDDLMNMDFIFLFLQNAYNTALHERKSVIIFDEVQQCPKARQAIKYLRQVHLLAYIRAQKTLVSQAKSIASKYFQWTMRSSDGQWETMRASLCYDKFSTRRCH